jgi:hypothetical protein
VPDGPRRFAFAVAKMRFQVPQKMLEERPIQKESASGGGHYSISSARKSLN